MTVGDWDVEAANDVARAVVEQNGEFGVVPEPGTLTLLGAGYMGFSLAVSSPRYWAPPAATATKRPASWSVALTRGERRRRGWWRVLCPNRLNAPFGEYDSPQRGR